MNAYYLQTEQMTVGYHGKPLIEKINLCLRRGEIMTLIGPNGSGKSTILKSIVRQLRPLGGVVRLEQVSLEELSPQAVAQKMSVLMTDRLQPELMTCREVAAAGRYPYTGKLGLLTQRDWEKVDEALALVHGSALADQAFTAISDGQRQRVLLARALCQEPEILVLDEPTSFLDIRYKLEILSTLKELVRQRQLAVVLSLHELDLAQRVSDLVVCVHNNAIERCGPPEAVFTSDYITTLYELTQGSYEPGYGSLELPRVQGAVKAFVIGGNGEGIGTYRRLQREGVPFVAGVLHENDVEFPAARALAVEVIAQKAFEPIGAAQYQQAMAWLERCERVFCCCETFGTMNEPNRWLKQAGKGKTGGLDGGTPWPLNTISIPMERSSAADSPPGPVRPWRPRGQPRDCSPAGGRRRFLCVPPRDFWWKFPWKTAVWRDQARSVGCGRTAETMWIRPQAPWSRLRCHPLFSRAFPLRGGLVWGV